MSLCPIHGSPCTGKTSQGIGGKGYAGTCPVYSFFDFAGKPKRCIKKYDADMLKNLCKATRFDCDTHDTPL
jgi:hypothetical protein